ncbi:methyltransferase domain-containing protein [Actinomadura spongiicola]|uniref:Protein-L-isoaspartate O-methyltransferase n=1 Tax=Actinomadura spongiicola TaxID=2303421 RepID=A0A372GPC0_9ACTN|nr:methyltransferase domain-containing protein [Actinomadura spongiicola]
MTTPTADEARRVAARVDRLADALQAVGDLTDPRIRRALHVVPRHLFAPDRGWCAPDGPGERQVIDKRRDSEGWWEAVYSDASIVTQVDDGRGDPAGGVGEATSSLSAPGAVVAFLELLDLQPGDRILEIGTGTGWTAALLTALGAHVTTVEVDSGLAEQAAARLERHGNGVEVLVQDGAIGAPGRGSFDAVHVTCGVTHLPYAWVEQTRPGGRIAAPWMPEWGDGHKLNLTVTGDGLASGRLVGGADYMMLRAQRGTLRVPSDTSDARETGTRIDPRRVAYESYGADAAIAGLLPDVAGVACDGDRFELVLADVAGTSWARCRRTGTAEHQVLQAGPRNLWGEVADAYQRWESWGRPGRGRFGLSVGPGGQVVWLDDPSNVLRR